MHEITKENFLLPNCVSPNNNQSLGIFLQKGFYQKNTEIQHFLLFRKHIVRITVPVNIELKTYAIKNLLSG